MIIEYRKIVVTMETQAKARKYALSYAQNRWPWANVEIDAVNTRYVGGDSQPPWRHEVELRLMVENPDEIMRRTT